MTDQELVNSLRQIRWRFDLMQETADRIEQLERELVVAIEVVAESGKKRGEAEAKLEKAVRIIKRTAAQLDWCQAAKDISKELSTTLAELEGQ